MAVYFRHAVQGLEEKKQILHLPWQLANHRPELARHRRSAHYRDMAFTRSRPALTSAFTMRASSRSMSQCPPL